jgi:putative endonuclease
MSNTNQSEICSAVIEVGDKTEQDDGITIVKNNGSRKKASKRIPNSQPEAAVAGQTGEALASPLGESLANQPNQALASQLATQPVRLPDSQPATPPDSRSASKPKDQRKVIGAKGEGFACAFLERGGFKLLERNWRCKVGEVDIIALEEDDLVFIEVKTRTSLDSGFPEESVTRRKRQRYEMIAAYYLSEYCGMSRRVRFDVIAILITGEHQAFLKHHRDAFSCDS